MKKVLQILAIIITLPFWLLVGLAYLFWIIIYFAGNGELPE